ncbi:MAG: DUF4157 domain-containing protein [Leptolyngbyaceae cyanobacterium bins.59]|nr:DUF4157 domain-containing protein [Leptolyngbyaceae cyanobacterium bins.59]
MGKRSYRRPTSESSDRVTPALPSRPWSDPQFAHPPIAGQDFSHSDLFRHDPGTRSHPGAIQAKLTVGAPGDQYEQEADQVANQVMNMPEPAQVQRQTGQEEEEVQAKPLAAGITPVVQRQEAMPEEEEPLQAKLIQREAMPEEEEPIQAKGMVQREAMPEEEEEPLQAKLIQREAMPEEEEPVQGKGMVQRSASASGQTGTLENQLNSSKGNGSPLSSNIRSFMEPRFGADFSQVRVHTGEEAVQMNQGLQAQAFTHGKDIYFGSGKSPGNDDLTAHELTHVVQQTGALQPQKSSDPPSIQQTCSNCEGGEKLQRFQSPSQVSQNLQIHPTPQATVQRLGQSLKSKPKVKPAHGTTKDGKQRQYSVEQYIAMWEAEQGRKLSDDEKATIARGCIGITALNLDGGGDPPLDDCYGTFEQAKARMDKKNEGIALMRDVALSLGLTDLYNSYKDQKAVLFAKLFWSNQDPDEKKRKVPNKKAFLPDKKTGMVDMTGYHYRDRPGFVNFDYGFWDEASQSFWHANHRQPGMKVYQSTKEKFAKGYIDFDRVIYCVAIANNYDPAKAVKSP